MTILRIPRQYHVKRFASLFFGTLWMATAASADLPAFDSVSDGYERVISTASGKDSLYGLYLNSEDHQLLAELPADWKNQKYFVASTPAKGVIFAGLQGPDRYVFWRRYGDRLALISPQLDIRADGDEATERSVKRIFTDEVILEVPIVAMGPNGQPVIDLDEILINKPSALGGRSLNKRLTEITKAKAFPDNIEVAVEGPDSSGGYRGMHYSISLIPDDTGYKPREADHRVGYFLTSYRDLARYGTDENWTRYINRWDLQKADPSLSVSPPAKPIVFYIEHTTPVRYRRWVREGILSWNKAFEAVGIANAIEVYQQDAPTGAHMDKDPEDVRYNFIRWLNNDVSTAIGPSRVHPLTGQILDADVVLTDGWIRAFYSWYEDRPQEQATSLTPEALAWLEDYPQWDPRIILAEPEKRRDILAEREARRAAGDLDPSRSEADPLLAENVEQTAISTWLGDDCQHCMAAHNMAVDMAFAHIELDAMGALEEPEGDMLDGIPEWYIGPHLSNLVAHEVGHTIGLRHNFKASSLYTMDEINSEEIKGKKPMAASVMDYLPSNFNTNPDAIQGDYTMIDIGPYDMWAVEYGYTLDDPKDVLLRVGQREHAYQTDDDTYGPDPLARRYDFSRNPIDYANSQMDLIQEHRARLLEDGVKDGESWQKARKTYNATLSRQRRMIDMMGNWVGGTHVARVNKGDENTGAPLEVVDVERQREALAFMMENAFRDEAFGLSPELVNILTVEKWGRAGGVSGDPTLPIHDRVSGTQNTALTLILNPSTLEQIRDNELRTPADQDALTLPEVFDAMMLEIYSEVDVSNLDDGYTNRQPMVSSLRRNLQSGMTDRLIAMATGNANVSTATRQLAQANLRKLNERLKEINLAMDEDSIDAYSAAHLEDLKIRTDRAREAIYLSQ